MGPASQRACPNCGLLVLTPFDGECPYCLHPKGTWVPPLGVQASLRDWRGTMLRLQASEEGSKIVLGLAAVPAAFLFNAIAPWTASWMVNGLMVAVLVWASFATGRLVVGALHRIPSPWPLLRRLSWFRDLRGPEAPFSLAEHTVRVRSDLSILDAHLSDIEAIRKDLGGRPDAGDEGAAERFSGSLGHLDRALTRLRDMKRTIEVGAAHLDHATWGLRLRALRALAARAGSEITSGMHELNGLLQEGKRTRAEIESRSFESTPEGAAVLEKWRTLEDEINEASQLLAGARERSVHDRVGTALGRAASPQTSHMLLQAPSPGDVEPPPALPEMGGIEDALNRVEAQASELEIQISAAEELQATLTQR